MTGSKTDLQIALVQANPNLGNVDANIEKLLQMRARAAEQGCDIILTPETYLSGYPADDLVLRADFMNKIEAGIDKLAAATKDGGPAIICGAPVRDAGRLFNAVFVLDDGAIKATRHKVNLPNYGVFDDKRHFTAGSLQGPVSLRGWPGSGNLRGYLVIGCVRDPF